MDQQQWLVLWFLPEEGRRNALPVKRNKSYPSGLEFESLLFLSLPPPCFYSSSCYCNSFRSRGSGLVFLEQHANALPDHQWREMRERRGRQNILESSGVSFLGNKLAAEVSRQQCGIILLIWMILWDCCYWRECSLLKCFIDLRILKCAATNVTIS